MHLTIHFEPVSLKKIKFNSCRNFVNLLNKIKLSALKNKMAFLKNIVEFPCVAFTCYMCKNLNFCFLRKTYLYCYNLHHSDRC